MAHSKVAVPPFTETVHRFSDDKLQILRLRQRVPCSRNSLRFPSGLVCFFRQIPQELEKRCLLPDEETHVRQELDRAHGNPFCFGRAVKYLSHLLWLHGCPFGF